jgi:zinc and cadmium transporter
VHYHRGVQVFAIAGGLSVLGSIGGVLVASLVLLFRDNVRTRLIPSLVSYAVGTLLGVALLALVPKALENLPARQVFGTMLAGIFVFFILEKLVLWRHCHSEHDCAVHSSAGPLIVVGDAFHTFVDGALIAAAVMTSIPLGLTTALAVVAHEIPQEVGDFAILLGAGYSRRQAFTLNLVAGSAGLAGAGIMILSAGHVPYLLPYVLAFAAGNFLYVAMADLIPSLQHGPSQEGGLRQVLLIGAGVATILML